MSEPRWPVAALDPVRRLQVLAATVPGAVVVERVLDAPFAAVWGVAGDLEHGVPRIEPLVARALILERDGDHLDVKTWSPGRVPTRWDVVLREGWCWMQARRRLYVVGMAAVPEGDRTRYAHLEASPRIGRVLRPFLLRAVRHDVKGIEREARKDHGLTA